MAEKIVFELAIQSGNVANQLDVMKASMKQINEELKLVDKNSEAYVKLRKESLETQYLIDELTKSQRNLRKEFAATQVPTDSLAGMRIEYGKLVQAITNMSKAQRESAEGQTTIKQAEGLKKAISEVEQSYGNFTGSVGNYKNSIIEAFGVLQGVGGTLGEKAALLTSAKAAFEGASEGAEKFGTFVSGMAEKVRTGVSEIRSYVDGLKSLKQDQQDAAQSSDVLGNAVGGIGNSAKDSAGGLAQSAQGATMFARAGTLLRTVLGSLGIGLVIAAVVGLISVFQKFMPIVDFVERAIAGVSASIDVFIGRAAMMANAVGKIFAGDFKGAFEDGKNAVSGMGGAMVDAGFAAAALAKEMQDLEDAQELFALSSARTELQIKKLEFALKDSTKSASERLKIASEITTLEKENLNKKTSLIDEEIEIERKKLFNLKRLSEEETMALAEGNIDKKFELEDEGRLLKGQADRIVELNLQRINAEKDSVATIERANNRKNAILEQQAEKQKAAAEKAKALRDKEQKEFEAQTKRISDLAKSIRDTDATTIINEFDKKITEIENKRIEALANLETQRQNILKKSKQTNLDKEELARLSELKASIIAATQEEIQAVELLRSQAAQKQLEELRKLQGDINNLTRENAQSIIELELGSVTERANVLRAMSKQEADARRRELEDEYAAGNISKQEFEEGGLSITAAYNKAALDNEREFSRQRLAVVKELADAKAATAKSAFDVEVQAIQAAAEAEINALKETATKQGIDTTEQQNAVEVRALEEKKAAYERYNKAVSDASKSITDEQLAGIDAVNAADASVHSDKLKRIEEEKQKRKEVQDFLIGAAGTVAGAVATIEKNRIEEEKTQRLTALDTEYEAKKKAAAGNAVLLAKLEAEQDKKRKAIELEAAREKKRVAIIEAVIYGALAVVKALPNPFLAAAAAIATAAQIAVINSQKFATGGAVKFGKQGMFGGKPHSAGGTKGYFDDGTAVEVEKDELFVILNKRASKAIGNLSNLNAAYGGKRFAAGGVLDFTPQTDVPRQSSSGGGVVVIQSGFSDEQIAYMAETIADKNAAKTQKAVANGLYDANRMNERQIELDASRQF